MDLPLLVNECRNEMLRIVSTMPIPVKLMKFRKTFWPRIHTYMQDFTFNSTWSRAAETISDRALNPRNALQSAADTLLEDDRSVILLV